MEITSSAIDKLSKTNNILASIIEKNEKAKRFAVDILSKGGIIAFKADTIYGLSCDARNDEAVKRRRTGRRSVE